MTAVAKASRPHLHDRERPTSISDGTANTIDLRELEGRLGPAFLARYGGDVGPEVTAETMAWAWEHRAKLEQMHNPAGYLYRVGQSKSRRLFRWRRETVRFPEESRSAGTKGAHWIEPGLSGALAKLDKEERIAVILVHCFQWSYNEVGELLELPLHTVRNRLHRGLARLRTELGAA